MEAATAVVVAAAVITVAAIVAEDTVTILAAGTMAAVIFTPDIFTAERRISAPTVHSPHTDRFRRSA